MTVTPYYVATTYEKKVGFSGDNATGVLVINPMTGDMKEYEMAIVPAWVDVVEPASFIEDQINDWGQLVHGWFNPSHSDELKVSTEPQRVDRDGEPYYYLSVTSVGHDNGVVGYMLVNMKTKQTTFYRQPG